MGKKEYKKLDKDVSIMYYIDNMGKKGIKMSWNRENILSILREKIIEIEFTKANGELRTMKATLKQSIVSECVKKIVKKTNRTRVTPKDVISVIDVDLEEWRSFRLDNLNKITMNNHS